MIYKRKYFRHGLCLSFRKGKIGNSHFSYTDACNLHDSFKFNDVSQQTTCRRKASMSGYRSNVWWIHCVYLIENKKSALHSICFLPLQFHMGSLFQNWRKLLWNTPSHEWIKILVFGFDLCLGHIHGFPPENMHHFPTHY